MESALFSFWGEASGGFQEGPLRKHAEKVTVHFQLTGLKPWARHQRRWIFGY